jgi:hypothetical protein
MCCYSSQVLFSISQKLIQHQIMNYTDILKWLRDILMCRNAFLLRHKDYANVGSQIAICKQAHIKLEVRAVFDFGVHRVEKLKFELSIDRFCCIVFTRVSFTFSGPCTSPKILQSNNCRFTTVVIYFLWSLQKRWIEVSECCIFHY